MVTMHNVIKSLPVTRPLLPALHNSIRIHVAHAHTSAVARLASENMQAFTQTCKHAHATTRPDGNFSLLYFRQVRTKTDHRAEGAHALLQLFPYVGMHCAVHFVHACCLLESTFANDNLASRNPYLTSLRKVPLPAVHPGTQSYELLLRSQESPTEEHR